MPSSPKFFLSRHLTLTIQAILLIGILFFTFTVKAGQFNVPDTGQTKCYNDDGYEIIPCPEPGEPFYGQDGTDSCDVKSADYHVRAVRSGQSIIGVFD